MPFQLTGSWSRFSCLWRFLLEQEAEVTLAFLEKGQDTQLQNFRVRYLGESTTSIAMVGKKIAAEQNPEWKQFSPVECDFLLKYEPSIYHASSKVRGFLDEVISTHDIITCEYPLYAPLLSEYCKKWGKRLIVTSHDILYELHGLHPKAKERLKEKEVAAMALADALVFCNDEERQYFETHGLKGTTVLNTGDVIALEPGREEESRAVVRSGLKMKTPHYCLFVGSHHGPNVEAVGEVRRLSKLVPEVTFVVAGNCSPQLVEANFVAVGVVSDQMLDLLYRGALAIVVPLVHGTGGSVKTFQALSYGKVVVSSTVGARGLSVQNGSELVLSETVSEMAVAVRRVMADAKLRREIGVRARAFALALDYRTHFEPYADIICRLTPAAPEVHPPRTRSLILVDNTLTDRVGHHFNYALSLKDECLRQGVSFRALINAASDAEVTRELSACAEFSAGIHDAVTNPYPPEWGNIRSTYELLVANDVFAQELSASLASVAYTSDVVFLPNATSRQMLGLAALLVNQPALRALKFVLLLRYSNYRSAGPITDRKSVLDTDAAEAYRMGLQRLVNVGHSCVRLVTDSSELAKEFEPLAKRSVEVLPIPHTLLKPRGIDLAEIPVKAAGEIRAVYLGDARDEKGFELLPAIVRACASHDALRSTQFVFQAFISSHYHLKMAEVIRELERLKLPGLHLIMSPLSAEAYEQLLDSADLVLLPYDAVTYKARTSGPFVEAICANKPVVVPQHSWMSAQLGQSGAGVCFSSGSSTDVARAVRQALMSLPALTTAAAALGETFRRYHNPTNFVARLMEKNSGSNTRT